MHAAIYKMFEDIVSTHKVRGRILEVGAVPKPQSLLAMGPLRNEERVGVNIKGNIEFGGFKIIEANGNNMHIFADGHFDCVLSNATIEHDPYFWKTCAEIRRVLRVGGIAIIGAPGFTEETSVKALRMKAQAGFEDWENAALTFRYHGAPSDFYRFSINAFREVIFEGYQDVVVNSVMIPPRLIGYGYNYESL
jgi:SAM-dependent methyltransferase